jgi:hypothetical protein
LQPRNPDRAVTGDPVRPGATRIGNEGKIWRTGRGQSDGKTKLLAILLSPAETLSRPVVVSKTTGNQQAIETPTGLIPQLHREKTGWIGQIAANRCRQGNSVHLGLNNTNRIRAAYIELPQKYKAI